MKEGIHMYPNLNLFFFPNLLLFLFSALFNIVIYTQKPKQNLNFSLACSYIIIYQVQ